MTNRHLEMTYGLDYSHLAQQEQTSSRLFLESDHRALGGGN